MKIAQVDYDTCQACDKCEARKSCRTKAIMQMDRGEQAIVKSSDCMGCADCVEACPHGAISMKET